MSKKKNIGIIGGGNMGQAMLGGFLQQGIAANTLFVADHSADTCTQLNRNFGIYSATDNASIADKADILIVAVKPQQMRSVLEGIAACIVENKLLISIAAGITSTQIFTWLNKPNASIIRAMPNTPALIGEGITALYATPTVSEAQQQEAQVLLSCLGKILWIKKEEQMDTITALSGSGPAYFFYMMEGLITAAMQLGLSQQEATELTLQTALGSIKMAVAQTNDLKTLREKVTSKGGTTERGIQTLTQGNFLNLLENTIAQASQRAKEISQAFN